ncbi:MAG: M23 family metallopeptidase [Xanthobacteraceae bacterium]
MMTILNRCGSAALLTLLLLGLAAAPASAQKGFKGGEKKGGLKGFKGGGPASEPSTSNGASAGTEGRLSIRASGIVAVFDPGVRCPPVASPFASTTRYDGSRRPADRFGGLHGGIDISLAEGTPLLAAAGGRVVHKGEGRQAEGIYLWLQHAPDDTGLPFWVYSKYQHFRELPGLAPGAAVRAGQPVGNSGRSGTAGGHYGAAGYPHLHWTTIAGTSGDYKIVGSLVSTNSPQFIDPLAAYVSGLRAPGDVGSLPADRKRVAVAHVGRDGAMRPPSARLVWPVACAAR